MTLTLSIGFLGPVTNISSSTSEDCLTMNITWNSPILDVGVTVTNFSIQVANGEKETVDCNSYTCYYLLNVSDLSMTENTTVIITGVNQLGEGQSANATIIGT